MEVEYHPCTSWRVAADTLWGPLLCGWRPALRRRLQGLSGGWWLLGWLATEQCLFAPLPLCFPKMKGAAAARPCGPAAGEPELQPLSVQLSLTSLLRQRLLPEQSNGISAQGKSASSTMIQQPVSTLLQQVQAGPA